MDGIFGAFFQRCPVLSLHGRDLNLLFGDFFTQELDALCFLLIARRVDSVLADLEVQLVQFPLSCPFTRPFVL